MSGTRSAPSRCRRSTTPTGGRASKEGPGYAPPACGTPTFADVPCSSPFAPWIEELYRRGITELARQQITSGCGGASYCPDSNVTRGQMAVLLTRTFDLPILLPPTTARTVRFAYTQGLLTSVSSGPTSYGAISYHPNLLVSQVAHGNGVVETQGNDGNSMRRPSSEGAAGPYATWSSDPYAYDGAGNITRIGTSSYLYDKVSRLTSGTLFDGPTGGGVQKQQSYTFDAFGNLTSIAGTSGRATPTSAATNRLNGAGTQCDAAGNLTNWNGAVYQYDRFNQMTRMTTGGEDRLYVYTADDERIWSFDFNRIVSHWTLRDLNGKVLRLPERQRPLEPRHRLHLPRRPAPRRRNAGRPAPLLPRPSGHPAPHHESLRLPGGLSRLLPLRRRSDRLQPGHREAEVHRARERPRELGRGGG
jgi:hypothetical protein